MTTVTTCDKCGKTVPDDLDERVCVVGGFAVHVSEVKYEHDYCADCKQEIATTGTWMPKKEWRAPEDEAEADPFD